MRLSQDLLNHQRVQAMSPAIISHSLYLTGKLVKTTTQERVDY